jgi:molybdopterin synthase sulfur carrier subunit
MQWKLFADLAERAGDREVTVDVTAGDTVDDALDALLEARPALADRVVDDDGNLESDVNVLRNGHNVVTEQEGLTTVLKADDELALFPPVSGGV